MELTKFNPAQIKNKLCEGVFGAEVTELGEGPVITERPVWEAESDCSAYSISFIHSPASGVPLG